MKLSLSHHQRLLRPGLLGLVAICCVQAGQARAECAPNLTLPNVIQTPAYDPFAQTAVIDDSDLSYSDTTCDASTVVTAGIGWGNIVPKLVSNGQELAFRFFLAGRDYTSGQSDLGEANSLANGVAITLPNLGQGTLPQQVRLFIPEGQVVPPGSYRFDIAPSPTNYRGLLSQVQGQDVVRAAPVSIVTEVLAVMKLGVVGCDLSAETAFSGQNEAGLANLATSCQLNIGDPSLGMANGDNKRARLNAQANVNFKISMISRNGGMLKLSGNEYSGRDTEQVRYTASLEGQGQSAAFACAGVNCGFSETISPSTSPVGTDLYLQVRINEPDLAQKRAGKYSDTITLIIQPAS